MGAGTYITLLSVYTIVLTVGHRAVPGIVTYVCPEHTYCCSPEYYRCCPETSTADLIMITYTVILIAFVICWVCKCCVCINKNTTPRRGSVRERNDVVSVDLTPQTCEQVHPIWCIQAQSPYPPPDAYNPYYGIPPPGTSTVVHLPPPSVPQGYPGYSSAHPPYPTNQEVYNPYWGISPEYQAAVTTPTAPPLSTSHIVPVVPVASAPPAN